MPPVLGSEQMLSALFLFKNQTQTFLPFYEQFSILARNCCAHHSSRSMGTKSETEGRERGEHKRAAEAELQVLPLSHTICQWKE